jgi:hypothetical protein
MRADGVAAIRNGCSDKERCEVVGRAWKRTALPFGAPCGKANELQKRGPSRGPRITYSVELC